MDLIEQDNYGTHMLGDIGLPSDVYADQMAFISEVISNHQRTLFNQPFRPGRKLPRRRTLEQSQPTCNVFRLVSGGRHARNGELSRESPAGA